MSWKTAVILIFILFLAACQDAPPPATAVSPTPPKILRLGISSSAAPFADLTASYTEENDQAILQFVVGNNETLWADLADGRLDAIFVHHIPPGNDNWFNPVALDGLVLLVHPGNPVETLSLAEAQALFNGRIQNWQEVGGEDQPIILISREAGSGVLALLNQAVLVDQPLNINAQVAPSNEAMLAAVRENPHALGFSMMGSAIDIKTLPIAGIAPTPDTVADQSYPLTTPLYFVHQSPQEPEGELRAFLAWVQSEDGQAVIGERYGRVR